MGNEVSSRASIAIDWFETKRRSATIRARSSLHRRSRSMGNTDTNRVNINDDVDIRCTRHGEQTRCDVAPKQSASSNSLLKEAKTSKSSLKSAPARTPSTNSNERPPIAVRAQAKTSVPIADRARNEGTARSVKFSNAKTPERDANANECVPPRKSSSPQAPNTTKTDKLKRQMTIDEEFLQNSLPPDVPAFFLSKALGDAAKKLSRQGRRASVITGPTPILESSSRSASNLDLRKEKAAKRQMSMQTNGIKRRTSGTSRLTGPQIIMVRTAWRNVLTAKGPTVLGCDLLTKVFFKMPQIRNLIHAATPPNGMANSDQLIRFHYKAIAEMIDLVIRNLDDLNEVSEDLCCVGARHAEYYEGGMRAKFWTTFAEAFIDCTMEWGDKKNRSEEIRIAWAIVATFLAEKLKQGMIEERRRKQDYTQVCIPASQSGNASPVNTAPPSPHRHYSLQYDRLNAVTKS